MILERFNAVVFVGDQTAQFIYAAFNILLQEDLSLGGLQQSIMSEQDRTNCKCDNQFTNKDCFGYLIKSLEEAKKNVATDQKRSLNFCQSKSLPSAGHSFLLRLHLGIPHAYIPVDTVPSSNTAQSLFKDLTYSKSSPWQPSPVIFSLGQVDVETATRAVDEWSSLATGAEHNIPMLFVGPPAFSLMNALESTATDKNIGVWQFQEQMAGVAKEKHFDILGLYNLTVQASSVDGERFGSEVGLVEAMMVSNWLSKLETF